MQRLNLSVLVLKALAENHKTWALDYTYSRDTNEFIHKEAQPLEDELVVGFHFKQKKALYIKALRDS
jgi:hypothetical protein